MLVHRDGVAVTALRPDKVSISNPVAAKQRVGLRARAGPFYTRQHCGSLSQSCFVLVQLGVSSGAVHHTALYIGTLINADITARFIKLFEQFLVRNGA